MTHAAVRDGRTAAAAVPGRGRPGRIRRGWLDLATTPGRLRLLLAGLVLLSLAWGALAAVTAARYASAASSVATTREPLSLDAQRIYAQLSDADDAAVTAFLTGGIQPAPSMHRYLADITAAGSGIENATAQGGAGSAAAAADLAVLAQQLPVYNGEVETARADNRLGLPLGSAYLREASGLMRDTLLPKAEGLYAAENAALSGTSARATGLPLVCVTAAVGLVAGYLLFRSSRWLRGRTNRVLNVGLVAAGVVGAVSLAWLAFAYSGARSDMLAARSRGLVTVQAVAQVSIAAQEAHADESLTLIDNTGYDQYQADYLAQQRALGPGPGALLTDAQTAAAGTPAAAAVTAAVSAARTWFAAHARVRSLDDNGDHAAAVSSALGAARGNAGASFTSLSDDLNAALGEDQAVFDSTARSASGAYSGLEAGLLAAAVVMAAACAWGLSRRLAEYR